MERSTPGVVFRAQGDTGDIATAAVVVDGVKLSDQLDGLPLRLDPGTHLMRVELPDGQSREVQMILTEGEPIRVVELDFRSPPPLVDPSQSVQADTKAPLFVATRPMRTPSYILAGASVVSAGFAIGFGIDALSEEKKAHEQCAPNCDELVSKRVRTSATISDITMVTAISAGVGALVLYYLGPIRYVPGESSTALTLQEVAVAILPRSAQFSLKGEF